MDHVTLPALENLEVVIGFDWNTDLDEAADLLVKALSSLQHRSSSQLRELTIHPEMILTSPNFTQLSLHTIRILHILFEYNATNKDMQREALKALQDSTFFSGLTTLHIEIEFYSDNNPVDGYEYIPALVKMLDARRTNVGSGTTRLASIRLDGTVLPSGRRKPIDIPQPADSPSYQHLLELRRDGLELSGSGFPW
ncbi:hypothetical protein PQX77_005778 [Marasmius sp. AFHP31]|nr:hypothetical protein PQX77_005778 [Marasmius sp. AFHP31]